MDLTDLQLLVDYHYWARNRLLDAVSALTPEQFTRTVGGSFPSVRDTLVHLYSGDSNWYQRWLGRSPAAMLPPEQFPDVESIRKPWAEQEAGVRAFVNGLGESDVARVFEFKMLSGKPASAVFWQMLQHMVNHGSYHRGQVTNMLRQLGASPAKGMDMIVFYRERAAA